MTLHYESISSRRLARARSAVVFIPVALTWMLLFLAALSYSDYSESTDAADARGFFEVWQQDLGGHWWSFPFWFDALLIFLAIVGVMVVVVSAPNEDLERLGEPSPAASPPVRQDRKAGSTVAFDRQTQKMMREFIGAANQASVAQAGDLSKRLGEVIELLERQSRSNTQQMAEAIALLERELSDMNNLIAGSLARLESAMRYALAPTSPVGPTGLVGAEESGDAADQPALRDDGQPSSTADAREATGTDVGWLDP